MARHIAIIDGHPDPDKARFCHALAAAYSESAQVAGHTVRQITVTETEIAILRSAQEWENLEPPAAIRQCQQTIGRADHLVVIYPLWPGSMPAVLKGFFEQVFRPGFAIAREHARPWPGLLTGKSARIIVTRECRPGFTAGIFSPTASRAWSEYSPVLRHQAGP